MLSPLAQRPQAERLQAIVSTGDVATVKRTIEEVYGFEPTEEYCRDLVVFVDSVIAAVLEPDGGKP